MVTSVTGGRQQNLPRETLKIIADNAKRAGFSIGWFSALDNQGRILCGRRDGRRFVVRADELLTAFLKLQRRYTRWRLV